jgi:hypothetical protein
MRKVEWNVQLPTINKDLPSIEQFVLVSDNIAGQGKVLPKIAVQFQVVFDFARRPRTIRGRG